MEWSEKIGVKAFSRSYGYDVGNNMNNYNSLHQRGSHEYTESIQKEPEGEYKRNREENQENLPTSPLLQPIQVKKSSKELSLSTYTTWYRTTNYKEKKSSFYEPTSPYIQMQFYSFPAI